MNVKRIINRHLELHGPGEEGIAAVREYLEDEGYDGLCGEDCGCGLDDLFPCLPENEGTLLCTPGYRYLCKYCPSQLIAGCEWPGYGSKGCFQTRKLRVKPHD